MKKEIYLAPLSGITDLPFRIISRELKAGLCFFEMIDANALVRNHRKTPDLFKTLKKDRPIAAQILGADPNMMLDAALKLTNLVEGISFLDINSGCPAKKVIKKKAGAYLLEEPKALEKIIKNLTKNIDIPITIKLRSGFSKRDPKEIAKIARMCEDNGVSKIFIHGRTRSQGYAGEVDYESIKSVKDAVRIPVFGSGNILNPQMAKRMFGETGCDGILVARGALGNPWIFRDLEAYFKDGKIPKPPSLSLKKRTLKKHLSLILKYRNMRHSNLIGFMGKVSMWYLKGIPNATRLRDRISRAKSRSELSRLINSVKE